jgi:hypothetical protein
VIKDLRRTKDLALLGSVLNPGELFIYKSLFDYLAGGRKKGDGTHSSTEFIDQLAHKIYRGVFKPSKGPAFGFECHQDHLEEMVRIMAADCALDHVNHEIPHLLSLVDQEIRAHCPSGILREQIARRMAISSEELFFNNGDEFEFR